MCLQQDKLIQGLNPTQVNYLLRAKCSAIQSAALMVDRNLISVHNRKQV